MIIDKQKLKAAALAIGEGNSLEELEADEAMFAFEVLATPSAVLDLLAEIERLERKNVNQSKSIREYQDLTMGGDVSLGMLKADLRVTAGERDELKDENEALRKDAERYRWIRQYTVETLPVAGVLNSLDKQIDEAMAREAK